MHILSDISQFQKGIHDNLNEFEFYSTESWNAMIKEKNNNRFERAAGFGSRKVRQYEEIAVGAGGKIDEGLCQCALQSTGCPPGPPGTPGEKGKDGEPGHSGEPGSVGNLGVAEAHPMLQSGCIPCPQGPPGSVGPDGPIGPPGSNGNPGSPSSPPSRGPPGPPGPPGPLGPFGIPGLPGNDGQPGQMGTRSTNLPGSVGPPGPIGPPGSAGNPGTSSTGLQGAPGQMGQPGKPGNAGIPGEIGPIGRPGLPGHDGEYCKCPLRTANLGVAGAGGGGYIEASQGSYRPSRDHSPGFSSKYSTKKLSKNKARVFRNTKKVKKH